MGHGPLAGIRVVELAGLGPAPFAAMMLAEMGADVLRIDRPVASAVGLPPEQDLLNLGRPAIRLDLKQPAGVDVVRRLVDRADAFIDPYRPGAAERLGLGPADLLARRPALVYGRMTGWGQTGPWAVTAGHDITYLAVTGDLHAIGPADTPAIPLNLVGDFGGGALYLVAGILAALLQSRTSGHGQVVDAAIIDGATHLSTITRAMLEAGLWRDERAANLFDGAAPFYTVYETADGRHLAVGALEPQFYAELLRLLEMPDDLPDRSDRANWPALRGAFAARFRERTRDDWAAVFDGSDACVAPVLSLTEAADHPQLAARGTLTRSGGVVRPAPAPRFSRTPSALTSPAYDVRAALRSWGVDDAEGS
ncbi:MAG: CaiB/BaiF CoA transferase family protein [Sciscionella sp.]